MSVTSNFSNALEPIRLRLLASPIPGWLRAAGDALLSLVPVGLRRRLSVQQRRLFLTVSTDGLWLRVLKDDKWLPLGVVPLDDPELLEQLHRRLNQGTRVLPRWLLLDAQQVLIRRLPMPASAEPRLAEVMIHEIDRQTPFSADQITFEARVAVRDVANRQLQVDLIALPKVRMEQTLVQLGPLAENLAGIDVLLADGVRLDVNLLPAERRTARSVRTRNLNRWLALATVLVLFLALWLSLENRRTTREGFVQRVAAANVQVRDVRKLRNALESSLQAANFLGSQRAGKPTMLELIADFTHRLPDTTSLEKISVSDGRIVLIGQSQQASSLVGVLQDSPLITKPALAGSVQTDPRTGRERFTLTANVVGSHPEGAP